MRRDENTPAMLSRSSDHASLPARERERRIVARETQCGGETEEDPAKQRERDGKRRSEEHTSELQSRFDLVCRLLLEKKKKILTILIIHIKSTYLSQTT